MLRLFPFSICQDAFFSILLELLAPVESEDRSYSGRDHDRSSF
jgi:hypothetical protein